MNNLDTDRVDEATSVSDPVISIRNLSHTYKRGNLTVFENVNLEVGKGENLVLLGPSGGGKSTLLRCINRLVKASSGAVHVFGTEIVSAPLKDVRKVRRDVGMVFQSFNLINRISVLDNVLVGRLGYLSTARSFLGLYHKEDIAEAMHALDRVNLSDFADQLAMNLSGGQRQRVAIARALAQRPKILLADEPVSNLDPLLEREILGLLQGICREDGITSITSLHDVALAEEFSSRLVGVRDRKVTAIAPGEFDHDKLQEVYGT
ncbi:MAG: phosphonate ABC transporter ATP-binding protein [Rhodospirillaceae bacterium]|jgi:phosphonate transport system ATP-binding protein|nr:phosphonate ABC transporter ATP-binding protein [Rhodospirillaceae bacterium]